MKRSSRLIILLAAAAITFASLAAFVGTDHWGRWHHHECAQQDTISGGYEN